MRSRGKKREKDNFFSIVDSFFWLVWFVVIGERHTQNRNAIARNNFLRFLLRFCFTHSSGRFPACFCFIREQKKKKENIRTVCVKYVRVKILYEEKNYKDATRNMKKKETRRG